MARRKRRAQGESPLPDGGWEKTIEEYVRLRDLERTGFQRELRLLVEQLRKDAQALYRAGLRQQVRANEPEGYKASDYTSRAIGRRIEASKFTDRHLNFTGDFLGRLNADVPAEPRALRSQAWWLDSAAELVTVWMDLHERRRLDLAEMVREPESTRRARGPSVGLDAFIGQTLACSTAETAQRLVDAGVFPERENEENDPVAQWKETLRRARQRYRRRYGLTGTQPTSE